MSHVLGSAFLASISRLKAAVEHYLLSLNALFPGALLSASGDYVMPPDGPRRAYLEYIEVVKTCFVVTFTEKPTVAGETSEETGRATGYNPLAGVACAVLP